jgi:hypothetical protein
MQLSWDETVGGESHLTSVLPLYHSIKWFGDEPETRFMCAKMPLPYDPRPAADRTPAASASMRFREGAKKMSLLEAVAGAAGVEAFPKSYDARTDHARSAKCRKIIEHPQWQHTCGACYAFGALSAASIRACMAGHDDIQEKGFSEQDVISCGSSWEGTYTNNADWDRDGSNFAGGCTGWRPYNTFEYAATYGLVDKSCHPYLHEPDADTGFDAAAGEDLCWMRNGGGNNNDAEIDVLAPPSHEYVKSIHALRQAVSHPSPSLTPVQTRELRRLVKEHAPAHGSESDEAILNFAKAPENKKKVLAVPKPKLMRAKLAGSIGAGVVVSIDNAQWCSAGDGERHNFRQLQETNKGDDGVCMGKMMHTLYTYGRRREPVQVSPEEITFTNIPVKGKKGTVFGNVDSRFCDNSADRLYYQYGRYRKKALNMGGFELMKFYRTGSDSRGLCHRKRLTGEFEPFDQTNKDTCGKVHKIFHNPVKIYSKSLTQAAMMREITRLGAVEAVMDTTHGFAAISDDRIVQPFEKGDPMLGEHSVAVFGWGEENGQKFWWCKNSWGDGPGTKKIFRLARGVDAARIESLAVAWVDVYPPGAQPDKDLSEEIMLPTSNDKGFCAEGILAESMRENKSKRDNACVSVECETDLSKGPACHVKFSESCPSKTSVNLVSDKQYRGISGEPGETKTLKTRTACIQDFHPTE